MSQAPATPTTTGRYLTHHPGVRRRGPATRERASLPATLPPLDAIGYPRQWIMPMGYRCLKIEHREPLDDASRESLGRALAFAGDRYVTSNWLLIIEDALHDNVVTMSELIRSVLPVDYRGRVAVVWIGRLRCCPGYKVQDVPADCRIFCSAHYRDAMSWVGVPAEDRW